MFDKKIEITKKNILEKFDYYDFVPMIQLLKLDKVFNRTPLRLDRELKNQPTVVSDSGIEGKYNYANFYSLERLKEDEKQAKYWANLITSYLKLLEQEYIYGKKETREVKIQYWSQDYQEIWQLKHEENKGKWYLIKLSKTISLPPQNWGD